MGASVGGGGGGGHGRRRRRGGGAGGAPIGEINVTPFVDVMLVLLIIFMVAAPLLTVGVPVDLPKTDASALPSESKPPLEVIIDSAGSVYLEKTAVTPTELIVALNEQSEEPSETRIRIRADQSVAYGAVAEVMASLNRNGYRKIALVTEGRQVSPPEREASISGGASGARSE